MVSEGYKNSASSVNGSLVPADKREIYKNICYFIWTRNKPSIIFFYIKVNVLKTFSLISEMVYFKNS
jgi:hypothetical protein